MAVVNKQINIKVFDSDGTTFKKTINPNSLIGMPSWNMVINGIPGECKINLNLPFDDFGEGGSFDYQDIVKIYEYDTVYHPNGILVYSGYISGLNPYLKSATEGVEVTVLSKGALLIEDFFKDGANYTVSFPAETTTNILQEIIDHFETIYPGLLTYGDNLAVVAGNVNIELENKKWLDAIKETFKKVPAGYYWRIDESGELWLQQKPAEAEHILTIGKEIQEFNINKTTENIINAVRVDYDGGSVSYEDAASIAAYGRRGKIINDSSIKDANTANIRAEKEVNDNKGPKIRGSLVLNSEYDLESIKPGSTCKIVNYKKDSTTFDDNMQIHMVTYNWDTARIELEDISSRFGAEIARFNNE